MNKRIKELRRQATLVETYTANDGTVAESKSVDLEKFAELIIKECADIIDEHEDSRPYDTFGIMLKKHFGVEE